MDRTHVIYRCYDADGELLYIGQTGDLRNRTRVHRGRKVSRATRLRSSPWWPDVAAISVTRQVTKRAALRYERMAIRAEQPTHNVHFRSSRAEAHRRRTEALRRDPTLAMHGKFDTYTNWGCRCELCRVANTEFQRSYYRRQRASR